MDVKNLSIDEIGLSVRSINALHNVGVSTVGEILRFSNDDLFKIKNIGKKSIEEIVEKIEYYKKNDDSGAADGKSDSIVFLIPEDFAQWIVKDINKQMVVSWLKEKDVRIETLELLSAKAFNLLTFSGYDYIHQVAFLSQDKLMEISRMDKASAAEIERLVNRYVIEVKDEFFAYMTAKNMADDSILTKPITELIDINQYHDIILKYIKDNDVEIERMGLSERPKNALTSKGYKLLSSIFFMTSTEFNGIPGIGTTYIAEIEAKISDYIARNESRIKAFISGDESKIWDDEGIKISILNLYKDIEFGGLSLDDIVAKLKLPSSVSKDKIKSIIGQLISDNKLEYVDYRCYRVYGKFKDYLIKCQEIDERSRSFIRDRLNGKTLEAIGVQASVERERVRQIVNDNIVKVRDYYTLQTGMNLFDEDYYKYFYETYAINKQDGTDWLGVPAYVWNYLDLYDVRRGNKDLNEALTDNKIDSGLRLKIKNYLNRNKLYIDGMWIERRRADLERQLVRKFCENDVSFDDFCRLYNSFLEQEGVPYDDRLYCSDANKSSTYNRLSGARFLLWKMNKQIRYYDIDGRDYVELLDALNLDSYKNIEVSTLKFMNEYPEIMQKYDIRDQYELHNLLNKIIPRENYPNISFDMPNIKFGNFDRDSAILDILVHSAPIKEDALVELIHDEYGYEPDTIRGSYLNSISQYKHQGFYTIDQKQMSVENRTALENELTDDFYYFDEIRNIYQNLIPNADVEEINPFNLKAMGFLVYSRCALKNHSSLDAFFYDLLTKDDIVEISSYRKRFVYIPMFSQKLLELKRSLKVVEFEPNKIISFRKLEQSGITRDMIQDFCDSVYDFVLEKKYFSAKSLKMAGFESNLYDFGFSDWFYANLLISDDRFSFGTMFGNLIFCKGKSNITIKSFITNLIQEYGSVNIYDLIDELIDKYGCERLKRADDTVYDIVYKVQGSEVYYDNYLHKLYANKDIFYSELEEGGAF